EAQAAADQKQEISEHGLLYLSLYDGAQAKSKGLDLALVRFLRVLTARYMCEKADDWEACNGISFNMLCEAQGMGTVQDFCDKVVLPLGVEAESLVMSAIVPATDISLRVAILDRTDASGLCFNDYVAKGGVAACGGIDPPTIHVQLRPGHYDLLYFRDKSNDTLSPMAVARARPPTFGLDGAGSHWELQSPEAAQGNSSEGHTMALPAAGWNRWPWGS
ncbi:unnamed protein product, partial [Polarella glacialis]